MMFEMVRFKVARIGAIPLLMRPPAILTGVLIPHQNGSIDCFRYLSVVLRSLTVLLQDVNADRQIRASGEAGNHRPTELCP